MVFNILFLPLLFFIGIITSYEDFKYGKVRNKWILLGLFWGLGVIFFFVIWYFIASPVTHFYYFDILQLPDDSQVSVFTVNIDYLGRVILNTVIALVTAFLMWRFNAWAAGDAKLFIVYSMLIPLVYYWKSYLSYFPSFVLLINIFIPIFVYLLIVSFLYYLKFIYFRIAKRQIMDMPKKNNNLKKKFYNKKNKKIDKKKKLLETIKNTAGILFCFIGVLLILRLFKDPIEEYTFINVGSLQVFVFAFLIIFSRSLVKVFSKPLIFKIIIIILVVILAYGFIVSPQNTWQILCQIVKIMIIFMIVFTLFIKLIDFHILKTDVREIKIENLEPRMNLVEDIIERLKKDKKFYNKHIGRFYPGGLIPGQVEAVKKWAKKNKKDEMKTVKIYRPFPFVVWMFVGVIITLLLKSSLLHPILGSFFGMK